ncbi:hypothetical protein WN55_06255 [Dufourea novaeangliae]|uniref:Uncharacterized protein n=1 Tax=Dufourea novaeangliae TaxID=178035 RepID=A0A154PQ93_DUFNO|nr:hypothetical protein WN55_06255 [Dufourea novaeangliae]
MGSIRNKSSLSVNGLRLRIEALAFLSKRRIVRTFLVELYRSVCNPAWIYVICRDRMVIPYKP